MAVYKSNNFNAGSAGTSATGSSTATSGDELARVRNGSATTTYTTTSGEVINGTSVRIACATAGTDNTYYLWDHTGVAGAGLRASFMFDGNPSATTQILALRRASSGAAAFVQILSTGKLRLMTNAGGAGVYDTPNAVSFDTHYQIDLAVQPGTGTGDGKISFAVYDATGGWALGTTAAWTSTTQNAGTGNIVRGLVGIMESGGSLTASIDNVTMTDTYALVGAVTTTYSTTAAVTAAPAITATGTSTGVADFHRSSGAWVSRETFTKVSGSWV